MLLTKEMGIVELVEAHPGAADVLRQYGLGCLGCLAARFETIEQGAAAHGIDIDQLMADLNASAGK